MKTKLFALLVVMAVVAPAIAQRGLNYHEIQVYDELGRKVTDITSVQINTDTTAQTIYQDALLSTAITNPMTTSSTNTTLSSGGFYWYGPDSYNISLTSTAYGTATFKGYNASITRVTLPSYWSAAQAQSTTDAQSISMGTDADWVLQGGATANRLTFTPAADGATMYIGSATYQADTTVWSGSGSTYWLFSQTNNALDFIGADAMFNDAAKLYWGTDSDWYAKSSTAKTLDLIPGSTTDETAIMNIGSDTAGADLKLFAATSGDYALWDASAASFNVLDGTISLGDADKLLFGDTVGTGDVYLESTTNVLTLGQVVSGTGTFVLGVDGKGVDTTFYAETAGDYMKWDQDAGLLLEDSPLALGDGTKILFGDTLATGDFSLSDESDVLTFAQIVTDTGTMAYGADGNGIDQTWYGESTNAYLKWDATGKDQLVLTGVDSSGTLFAITGVDTTGNSDTVTLAHSGTGDGLQITCSTATAVAENLIAAASQTTPVLKVDGATGSWLGAANVGMVNLTNDGALANVASSLLYINNTGVPQNDSRGSSLRIVDTGNAAAGTAGYAAYISATDATVEALYVDDGDVKIDDDLQVVTSIDGLGTATLGGVLRYVEIIGTDHTLTAADSSRVIIADGNDAAAGNLVYDLPAAAAGLTFTFADANSTAGDDLYIKAAAGDTINGGTAGQYLACKTDSAGQSVTLVAVDGTRWLLIASVGTWVADDTPD